MASSTPNPTTEIKTTEPRTVVDNIIYDESITKYVIDPAKRLSETEKKADELALEQYLNNTNKLQTEVMAFFNGLLGANNSEITRQIQCISEAKTGYNAGIIILKYLVRIVNQPENIVVHVRAENPECIAPYNNIMLLGISSHASKPKAVLRYEW